MILWPRGPIAQRMVNSNYLGLQGQTRTCQHHNIRLMDYTKQHYGQMFVFCMYCAKMCSVRSAGKRIPQSCKNSKMCGYYRLCHGCTHSHMKSRCIKHPRFIQTPPRAVLKGPGVGKYGLGTRGRKIRFRCCLIMSITSN